MTGIAESLDTANSARGPVLKLLEEAKILNEARNDFAHSFVVAHGPEGQLFVQKVRITNKRSRLELQEGTAWSISHVKEVTQDLAIWCESFESLLAREARKRWPE